MNVVTLQRSARGYLLDQDAEELQNFRTAEAKIQENLEILNRLVEIPEQKERLRSILPLVERTLELNRNWLTLAENNQVEGARQLFASADRQTLARNLRTALDNFNEAEDQIYAQKTERTVNALLVLLWTAILSTMIAIILGLLLGWIITARITETVESATRQIAISSSQISVAVEQHERAISKQASAVQETTITMDELGSSSQHSAERAESTKEQVDQIVIQILHLSEQVNQIETIANLVSEIANQTNLLALNAAVEAVRAGVHGKGFGVVASEIRKLADQSKRSGEKINTLIKDIRQATNSAIVVTNEGTQHYDSIVAAVNNIAVNAQQISLSAKQQAIAVQQVLEAMNNLNGLAQQTAEGVSQTKIGIQQLSAAANQLKEDI